MYENEIRALKRADLYRERKIFSQELIDLASNDYLGFSEDKDLLKLAYKRVLKYSFHSPKASQLVNGYHPIHKEFEEYLCWLNGFKSALVVGSGFLANISLIEALPRKGDLLILDELYHASGILASKLSSTKVIFFRHNDHLELKSILEKMEYKRAIICVEGIYSMDGDILKREIFDTVDSFQNTLLIVDEAHSSGVIGENFLGVFDHYKIKPKANYIKMGTLGKAYGSYGAYILAEDNIIEFLQNRAKAVIYTTAPSLFDIALAYEALKKIQDSLSYLKDRRARVLKLIKDIFEVELDGLILKIEFNSSKELLLFKERAESRGILIGAIRAPTVKRPIARVIPRLSIEPELLESLLLELKDGLSCK